MKKYLFLLLAFVGLSVSAQTYETTEMLASDGVTWIKLAPSARIQYKRVPQGLKLRIPGYDVGFYTQSGTFYSKSTGKVLTIYKGRNGEKIYISPSNGGFHFVSLQGEVTTFIGAPSSRYLLVMGDKGDDDDVQDLTLPRGYTREFDYTDNGTKVLFVESSESIIMASYIPANSKSAALSDPLMLDNIVKRRDLGTQYYNGFTVQLRGYDGRYGDAEMTQIVTFDNGDVILVSAYAKDFSTIDHTSFGKAAIISAFIVKREITNKF